MTESLESATALDAHNREGGIIFGRRSGVRKCVKDAKGNDVILGQ